MQTTQAEDANQSGRILSTYNKVSNLKGYALCRRPPLSGRGLCGGGYVVLAGFTGCWLFWVLWFPVECAEASWLLEVGFYCFPVTAVTLDSNFAILGVPNL